MGLRFCNEVIVAAEQIYPTPMEEAIESEANAATTSSTTPKSAPTSRRNSTLVNNQGFVAVPFVVDMGSAAPPSIRLIPCRPYSGAPIGEHLWLFDCERNHIRTSDPDSCTQKGFLSEVSLTFPRVCTNSIDFRKARTTYCISDLITRLYLGRRYKYTTHIPILVRVQAI